MAILAAFGRRPQWSNRAVSVTLPQPAADVRFDRAIAEDRLPHGGQESRKRESSNFLDDPTIAQGTPRSLASHSSTADA